MIDIEERFQGHYEEWQKARIRVIEKYYGDEFFPGKSILEVGAGFGDIGAYFAKNFDCRVTCTDAREEYVEMMEKRYPYITATRFDLDDIWWPFAESFDILFHMGVLYHQQPDKMEASFKMTLQYASYVVLETEVTDSDDPYLILEAPEDFGWDQSFHKKGSRPSPACVERILTESGFEFYRILHDGCNVTYHSYTWDEQNDGTFADGKRRCWFAKKI